MVFTTGSIHIRYPLSKLKLKRICILRLGSLGKYPLINTMAQEITLRVNGRSNSLHLEPDTPLLYVLRNDLGLKGAKFGCGLEQCGACKVIVDGRAIPSCVITVESVGKREVTTLEGLGTIDNLHPIQKAFIEEGAIQCGFCVGGIIMVAKALLDRNPYPTDHEIREELAGNLCRCGVHVRVLKAVKKAARQMER